MHEESLRKCCYRVLQCVDTRGWVFAAYEVLLLNLGRNFCSLDKFVLSHWALELLRHQGCVVFEVCHSCCRNGSVATIATALRPATCTVFADSLESHVVCICLIWRKLSTFNHRPHVMGISWRGSSHFSTTAQRLVLRIITSVEVGFNWVDARHASPAFGVHFAIDRVSLVVLRYMCPRRWNKNFHLKMEQTYERSRSRNRFWHGGRSVLYSILKLTRSRHMRCSFVYQLPWNAQQLLLARGCLCQHRFATRPPELWLLKHFNSFLELW